MITKNGQNFYSIDDIATRLNKANSSVYRLIQNYKSFLKDECVKLKGKNNYRASFHLSEKGVTKLLNLKGNVTSNQFSNALSANENELAFKEHVAEKAIESNQPEQAVATTGKLSQTIKALLAVCEIAEQNQQEIKQLQGDVAMLKGDTSKYPIRKGQREILNERVRGFSYNANVPFHKVWKKLHEQVGRKTLDNYVFEDYQLALNVIGEWSKAYQLDF
jgi:hypothetical protein